MAGLEIAESQIEDQCKLLFTTELNLATEKATVLSLKAELEKAKVEAQAVKEATQVAKIAAYEQGCSRQSRGWLKRWLKCAGTTAL